MKTASCGLRRLSLLAKKSSVAWRTGPPRRSAARSTRCVRSLIPSDSPRPAPTWGADKSLIARVDRLAPENGPHDHAAQRATLIGRDLVAVLERARIDREFGFGIPEEE